MEIKTGYKGDFEKRKLREYISYSTEELIHLFAKNVSEGKWFEYETLDDFGFIMAKHHLKIKSKFLETAYAEFLPLPTATRAAELTKNLMCYDIKPSWLISYKEIVDRAFELALADEELENLLKDTPLSIKWVSSSCWTDEIELYVNNSLFLQVSFFDDIYGENPIDNPNLHSINKETFAR